MRIPGFFSLLRFGRQSHPNPGPPVPNPDDIRPLPTPDTDIPLDNPNHQTILSQWQRLGTLDPKSRDYVGLLKNLVDVEVNRKLALKFTGGDARTVINVIDGALKSGVLQAKLAYRSFSVLRKLAGSAGELPDSCLINGGADYRVEEEILASGGFADVRRGTLGRKSVAVKTIRIAQDKDISKIRRDFCKESALWMYASHSNVLELIAVDVDPRSGTFSLISEFMVNGNITEYIRTRKANRIRLLEDVTKGLRYLHKCEIIHGDLKGANILIKNGKTPRACISDFGFSTVAPTASFAVSPSVDENKGTWCYMAPELLLPTKFGLRDTRVSKQADIYALGMVVYEVLTGRAPFGGEGLGVAEVIIRVMEGRRPRKPVKAGEVGFGKGTWELVQQCWNENRGERPIVEEICKHFQRVAKASKVAPPGPVALIPEEERPATTSEPESESRDFTQLFSSSSRSRSRSSATMVQQIRFVAGIVAGGDNHHSAASVPSVQLICAKPSRLDRFITQIKDRKPVLRLGPPTSPPVRA